MHNLTLLLRDTFRNASGNKYLPLVRKTFTSHKKALKTYDLKNDFVSVHHKVLLDKLEFYGMIGPFYNLIKPYLEHRYQRYKLVRNLTIMGFILNGKNQRMRYRKAPSLEHYYFLYINNLPRVINISTPVSFAYTTNVIIASNNSTNFHKNVDMIFNKLCEWFAAN